MNTSSSQSIGTTFPVAPTSTDAEVEAHLEPELSLEESSNVPRPLIYDDATGKVFRKGDTLKGNLTVGDGINLMGGLDALELSFVEKNRIFKAMGGLAGFAWYAVQDPVRQTAVADIAYNIGAAGLLRWPHFLSFMANRDYASAAAEIRSDHLWIAEVGPARSTRIITMIATGLWPADVHV